MWLSQKGTWKRGNCFRYDLFVRTQHNGWQGHNSHAEERPQVKTCDQESDTFSRKRLKKDLNTSATAWPPCSGVKAALNYKSRAEITNAYFEFAVLCTVVVCIIKPTKYSVSLLFFNVLAYYLAERLPERQPHRGVRTTAARNKHCEKFFLFSKSFPFWNKIASCSIC